MGCVFLLGLQPAARAAEQPVITAVASKVSPDYVRAKLADGSFAPEVYAFGEGGVWGGTMADASSDKLKFMDVARTIARPLLVQNYLPARDPAKTNLLIMVYWGTTAGTAGASSSVAYQNLSASQGMPAPPPPPPPNGNNGKPPPSSTGGDGAGGGPTDGMLSLVNMENRQRDKADARNAAILGYDVEGAIGSEFGRSHAFTAQHLREQDMRDEIEDNRYFVVLMAYDFQLLSKEKKHKLLWETRFSIRQRGNDFDKQLEAMAQFAARYFGQDSHGLQRKLLPTESVNLGELKFLGVEADKK